jgi:hypothetical protein
MATRPNRPFFPALAFQPVLQEIQPQVMREVDLFSARGASAEMK